MKAVNRTGNAQLEDTCAEAQAMNAEEEAGMIKEGWKPGTDKFRDEERSRIFVCRMM
jgi:hypothetical protein